VAVGDVHGDAVALRAALDAAGLLSPTGGWAGGETVLVQLGDVLDRWSEEREALSMLFRLQDEAPAAGGAVHLLMVRWRGGSCWDVVARACPGVVGVLFIFGRWRGRQCA